MSETILIHCIIPYLEIEIGTPGCYTPRSLNRHWLLMNIKSCWNKTSTLRITGGPHKWASLSNPQQGVAKILEQFEISIIHCGIYGNVNSYVTVGSFLELETGNVLCTILPMVRLKRKLNIHTLIFSHLTYVRVEEKRLIELVRDQLPNLDNIMYTETFDDYDFVFRRHYEQLLKLRPKLRLNGRHPIQCTSENCPLLIAYRPRCKSGFQLVTENKVTLDTKISESNAHSQDTNTQESSSNDGIIKQGECYCENLCRLHNFADLVINCIKPHCTNFLHLRCIEMNWQDASPSCVVCVVAENWGISTYCVDCHQPGHCLHCGVKIVTK